MIIEKIKIKKTKIEKTKIIIVDSINETTVMKHIRLLL